MSEACALDVRLATRFPGFSLDVAFRAPPGITALVGPSGSGKSTIVSALAGLLHPDEGRVVCEGRTLLDTRERIDVPAHRRRVGVVFQEGRLFPHLTVRANLEYGRFFNRAPREPFDRIVDLLGIAPLLERRPGKLSGGERQRVAIGRALLSDPRLLLMDEPLASLDEPRRAEIMPWIEGLRDLGLPIVYVSHSSAEVARLATTVFRLDSGGIVAEGGARETFVLGTLPSGLREGDAVSIEHRDGRMHIRRGAERTSEEGR